MSSTKIFILFAALVVLFGSVSAFGLAQSDDSALKAEIAQATAKIEVLEKEKKEAIENAKLAELAADEAVKRAQVAQAETSKAKAKVEEEKQKVSVEVINGIEYLPTSLPKAQEALISSLELELASVKEAHAETSKALVAMKKAYENSEAQRNLEHLQAEASKAALKSAKWRGRIEGFSVGIAGGLLAGLVK